VLVKQVTINKLRATWPGDETLDIEATNLSTHPALVAEPPRVTVKSSKDTFDLDLAIAPAALLNKQSELKLTLQNQSIDKTLSDFNLLGSVPLKGGTWLASIDGDWSDQQGLNLPLDFNLLNTNLVLGEQLMPVEVFPIEFGVVGAIDQPSLTVDTDALSSAVKEYGGKALMSYLSSQGPALIKDQLGEDAGTLIEGLGGLFGKKNPEDGKDDTDEKTDIDKIREGIGGFINRDNKDN
jgi:hypothetical protein